MNKYIITINSGEKYEVTCASIGLAEYSSDLHCLDEHGNIVAHFPAWVSPIAYDVEHGEVVTHG